MNRHLWTVALLLIAFVRPDRVLADSVSDLLIDGFSVPQGRMILTGATAGDPVDHNGQPGVQRPSVGDSIFGGERDGQYWVGFGPPQETWSFGVDPARGLYWDNDPGMHVNMTLEWDGAGDGTTAGLIAAAEPISVDLNQYRGFRVDFLKNSADLDLVLTVGNRDPNAPSDLSFPVGASQVTTRVSGGQDQPFSIHLPLASLEDPFAPWVPGADLSDVNVISLRIGSAPSTTGNSFVIRSFSAVAVPEPSAALAILSAGVLALGFTRIRRHRRKRPLSCS